jgi:hypothetical protein
MYISEVVCYVKSNLEKMIGNEDVHAHFTCQKSDVHVQYCRTTPFKNRSINMGIKLYNKLPNEIKKLEKLWDLKKISGTSYYNRHFIQWTNICPTNAL